ncbi:hypothetical protein AVEN_36485-1 [Araneus ventricosus]|uniref:Uncharacterized protein n=1 Tax=Araneus ventricosus TaxID=182803 RepID=A0A4Y2WP12_ARAVE|nr:hypothetical protein AVEN_245002-1 [Araneus ventricosus]GBO39245.1 hypothetical protein AVEN_208608-1 [Araneus ventricosus]GBO39248.1 hypothetical protein AVEN_23843-1 [Araneus ventricosus]GBO39249.1 hypothetical protein AVEN_36485-1 [Araneus ventricosus]
MRIPSTNWKFPSDACRSGGGPANDLPSGPNEEARRREECRECSCDVKLIGRIAKRVTEKPHATSRKQNTAFLTSFREKTLKDDIPRTRCQKNFGKPRMKQLSS